MTITKFTRFPSDVLIEAIDIPLDRMIVHTAIIIDLQIDAGDK